MILNLEEWLTILEYSFRWFEHAAETFVKIPLLGAVSYLTLAVSPFCIAFAVMWAVFRRVSFAWIGQDILVRVFLCIISIYEVFSLMLNVFLPIINFDIHSLRSKILRQLLKICQSHPFKFLFKLILWVYVGISHM